MMLDSCIDPQLLVISNNNIIQNQIIDYSKTFSKNSKSMISPYEKLIGVVEDNRISYEINSDGHRSDNFTNIHSGKHFLFSGCSITFGEGLPFKKNWSGYLYEEISKINQVSGYFNLSYPAGSVEIIINNIYKYCDKYGKPDTIFMFLPEFSRKNIWTDLGYAVFLPDSQNFYSLYRSKEDNTYYMYNMIKNLERFCNNSGIRLIWSCWSEQDSQTCSELDFSNYMHISYEKIQDSITNFNESSDPYFYTARDRSHPGLAFSNGISNIFLKEYNEVD